MNNEFQETLYFGYCRDLTGNLVVIDTAKQNGRIVPRFSPNQFEPEPEESEGEVDELLGEICQNLTAIERRTWLQLVDGLSILDVAAGEGVSRTAIYERIRGNSKGHGGMVAKNDYVAIWWRLRQSREDNQ
jgi:hypothetical protein